LGAASDVVYWRNGVTDLQNVNGLLANRRMLWIPKSSVQVDDRSPWAVYAESQPDWVLLHDHRIDMAVRPWTNADDPELPLDPVFREELLETKATVYSALETERAEAIGERMAEPMADFLLEGAPPAIFLNFEILPGRLENFAASIPLPRGFRLARVEPFSGECNNLVYWRNGVADKVYYNGSAYENVSLLPTEGVEIADGTRFANYVRLDHVFIYEQPQVFVVSPWNNLNELQGTQVTGWRPSRGRLGK
jgi:hypothetical protein